MLWGINAVNVSEKARHLFESVATVLLFGLQTVFSVGIFTGIMVIPLLPYIWQMVSTDNPQFTATLIHSVYIMLFAVEFWVGRLIAFVGVAILLVALVQLLLSRRKGNELIDSGLYSRMRHPQFTGIILITFGLSFMVATMGQYWSNTRFEVMSYWLLSAFGYIAIAKFEEWRLTKKLGDCFKSYSKSVPFLFPVRLSKKIPDIVLTVLVLILFWILLLYIPFPSLPQFAPRSNRELELSPFVLGVAIATWVAPFLAAAAIYLKKRK